MSHDAPLPLPDEGNEIRQPESTSGDCASQADATQTPLGSTIHDAIVAFNDEIETRLGIKDEHGPLRSFWVVLAKVALTFSETSNETEGPNLAQRRALTLASITWAARVEKREPSSKDLESFISSTRLLMERLSSRSGEMLAAMDTNSDGRISLDELKAYAGRHREYFLLVMGVSATEIS